MEKVYWILCLFLGVLNYNLKAQINVNGNMYVGDNASVFVAKNTSVGFDTLYIGRPNIPTIQTPFWKCDERAELYARGGIYVYGDPVKIEMNASSSLNLYNTTGNNKTYVVNVDPNINFIQNLNFVDTLDNISNVYLASTEDEIRVEDQFMFSNKHEQTVTLKPLSNKSLDLHIVSGKMNGKRRSSIVTSDETITLSKPVLNGGNGETFFVSSGINMDSFFSPVKIIATEGSSNRVKVASLVPKPQYNVFKKEDREEYVNNLWYINANGITKATVGMQHNPVLEIAPLRINQTYYYYPNDTATILRYVGSFPNTLGGETSYSNWETIKWTDKQTSTLIADPNNDPSNVMIYNLDLNSKYMQRTNLVKFDTYRYFAKIRYADDKAPLSGHNDYGRDPIDNSGHLLVPDYIEVVPKITGGNQVTLTIRVKNEYRIFGYEIYRNDINDPTFDKENGGSMVLAGTLEANAKTDFDNGKNEQVYEFVDAGITSVNNSTSFYYQIRPIGGTGRGARISNITEAGSANSKKMTILGNPVSKVQGMIRYRFASPDLAYSSLRVALVNSAGHVIGVENIPAEQTKFYESNAYFSTNNLAAGVYLLVAQATRDDGKVELFTSRIIVE